MASQLDRKIITGLAQDNLSKSMCAFSYVLKISYQLCITSLESEWTFHIDITTSTKQKFKKILS